MQGVGAKAAISLLSALTPDDLKQAILTSDKAMVSQADGVGPKLAQRIVNELAEKIGKLPSNFSNFEIIEHDINRTYEDGSQQFLVTFIFDKN